MRANNFMPAGWVVAAALAAATCGSDIDINDKLADEFAAYQAGAPGASDGGTRGAISAGSPTTLDADLGAAATLDHIVWDGLVRRFVGPGCFDYGGLRGSPEAVAAMEQVIANIAAVDPRGLGGRAEKIAFWVNAYNAFTVAAVAEKLAANPAFRVDAGDFGFFKEARFEAATLRLSLNMIENGILRKDQERAELADLGAESKAKLRDIAAGIYGGEPFDVRLHFALNCASRGCPPLRNEAYRAATLEAQFEDQARAFLNDAGKGAGPDGTSELLTSYFRTDFEAAAGSLDAFVHKYNPGASTAKTIPYNWALNACPLRKPE